MVEKPKGTDQPPQLSREEAIAIMKGGLGAAELALVASFCAPLYWVNRIDVRQIEVKNGSAFFLDAGEGPFDTFSNTTDELHLGTGNNTVVNNNGVVYGNTGNDTITAAAGSQTIHTGGGNDVITAGAGNDAIYSDHPTGVTSSTQVNYAHGDGTDTVFGFLQGTDSINISRLAGYVDPVVSISQVSGQTETDVHMTWYATQPVQGQPLPAHVDADMFLSGVLLTAFNQNQDYHVV
jgi:Ca2+-binding RTX toxin-like protein